MNQVNAFPVHEAPGFPLDVDLDSVHFDHRGLVVTLASATTSQMWRVHFEDALGHRVLDEGNLLEFWPTCSLPKGVIFEVTSGGWFEQESLRDGFLLKDTDPKLREFIVTGESACVNVLANRPPVVTRGS